MARESIISIMQPHSSICLTDGSICSGGQKVHNGREEPTHERWNMVRCRRCAAAIDIVRKVAQLGRKHVVHEWTQRGTAPFRDAREVGGRADVINLEIRVHEVIESVGVASTCGQKWGDGWIALGGPEGALLKGPVAEDCGTRCDNCRVRADAFIVTSVRPLIPPSKGPLFCLRLKTDLASGTPAPKNRDRAPARSPVAVRCSVRPGTRPKRRLNDVGQGCRAHAVKAWKEREEVRVGVPQRLIDGAHRGSIGHGPEDVQLCAGEIVPLKWRKEDAIAVALLLRLPPVKDELA